jgi:hypothetical protein
VLSCEGPLAPAAPAHLQPFLAVEASELLVVHDETLAAHQHQQTAIAEPAADRRRFAHAGTHGRIVRLIAAIAHRRAIDPECRTRPPLAHLKRGTKAGDATRLTKSPPPLLDIRRAHALLLLERLEEAKSIYLAHRTAKVDAEQSAASLIAQDFAMCGQPVRTIRL